MGELILDIEWSKVLRNFLLHENRTIMSFISIANCFIKLQIHVILWLKIPP